MRRLALAFAALMALLPAAGRAESLVSTLSDDSVRITSSFTGERIVVFGAVRGVPAGDPSYEIAVVVQGPPQEVVVREKERVVGVWANRASRTFMEVPSYYVMHLSKNFDAALGPEGLLEYRLGLHSLPFFQDSAQDTTGTRFAEALVDLRARRGLFAERDSEVTFLAPNVFRTTFFLPSDIPTGEYRVSVYLFRDKVLLAGETEKLAIAKSGFSERVARAALDLPFVYGLACVVLAVFTGWLAGVILRRG